MPEPTTSAGVTLVVAAGAIKVIAIAGVPLGLRPDVLLAGFCGALVAIVLLNTVPNAGDTWRALLRATVKRFFVVLASCLTAGYLTPFVLTSTTEQSSVLFAAFVVGAGAQRILVAAIDWAASRRQTVVPPPGEPTP